MMNSKKTITIMLLTSMFLSILLPAAHAVTFVSILTLDPEQGTVGTSVDVTGVTGDPNTAVDICFLRTALNRPTAPCDSSTTVGQATSDSTGSWSATIQIPESVAGTHPLLAVERQNSNIQAAREFTVMSAISVSPTSGAVDDEFQISGTGFAGNSQLTVNYDRDPVTTCVSPPLELPPVNTDQYGSFSAKCSVPESAFTVPDGRHEVQAVDQPGNIDSKDFNLIASVTITPDHGPIGARVNDDAGTTLTPPDPGVTVSVKARGFIPLASVTVCFDRSDRFQDCTNRGRTNPLGSFNFQTTLPQIPAGDYTFDANQTVSGFTVPDVRSAQFSVTTDLDLNPDHARSPTEVKATGTGFAATSSVIVTMRKLPTPNPGARPCSGDNVATLVTGRTLSTGSFTLAFSTPSVNPGLYQVYAKDSQGNDACADFAIGVFLRIKVGTPSEGKVGDTVTIQGFGFTETSAVTVKMTSTEASRSCDSISASFRTDRNGDFGTTTSNGSPAQFTVPDCNRGDYRVMATDSSNLVGTAGPYRVFPWIVITPDTGVVGSTITVTATGFASRASVDVVYFGTDGAQDQLAPRNPQGFTDSNSRMFWSGAIPQDLSSFPTGMNLPALTGVWQVETVGGEKTMVKATAGQLGNFETSFTVPESWGGFHPVYGRETVSKILCGPDGTGPVVQAAVQCGQTFRNQPTVTITPTDPRAGEILTLQGTGFMWWEHYTKQTVSNRPASETSLVFRLAFDIGRSTGYIDEAKHILNGQRDSSWDSGFYLPVALSQKGTIVYWDYKLEDSHGNIPNGGTLGQVGSPFVKAPSLQPNDYDLVAYRMKLGSLPTPDQSESTKMTITIRSAEKEAISTTGNSIVDQIHSTKDAINNEVDSARDAVMGGISSARDAIFGHVDTARDAINTEVHSARDAVMEGVSSAREAIFGHVDTAKDAINSNVNDAKDAINGEVHSARDAVMEGVSSAREAIFGHVDTATDSINSNVNSARDAINTEVHTARDSINGRVDAAKDAVNTEVHAARDVLKQGASTLQDTANAIKASTDSIKTNTDQVPGVKSTTETIRQDTSDLKNSVPAVLQTPMGYLLAILAAIAALGSIASALLISRRLKVAG